MAFDAEAALNRWADKEATVVVWRPGWAGDQYTVENLSDAVRLSQAHHEGAIEIEVQVHLGDLSYSIKGEELKAIAALIEP